MVTAEEFDAAVQQVIHNQVSDPKLEGLGKLLIPMTGAIFAKEVKEILFGKTEENKSCRISVVFICKAYRNV